MEINHSIQHYSATLRYEVTNRKKEKIYIYNKIIRESLLLITQTLIFATQKYVLIETIAFLILIDLTFLFF